MTCELAAHARGRGGGGGGCHSCVCPTADDDALTWPTNNVT